MELLVVGVMTPSSLKKEIDTLNELNHFGGENYHSYLYTIEDLYLNPIETEWDGKQLALINCDTNTRLMWDDDTHRFQAFHISVVLKNIIKGVEYVNTSLLDAMNIPVKITYKYMMYDDVLKNYDGVKYRWEYPSD